MISIPEIVERKLADSIKRVRKIYLLRGLAATLAALVWLFPCLLAVRIIAVLVAVFVIVKHKSNIQRLMKGCENRIY